MKIKVIYRKNLKMSEQKVASQVAHAVKNLGESPTDCTIIVLKVSDKKFKELTEFYDCYIQKDLGLTEVESGTETAAAWIEENNEILLNPIKIAIDSFRKAFEKDEDFRETYKANIAMAFKDEYANHYRKNKGKTNIHEIANAAADNFLNN